MGTMCCQRTCLLHAELPRKSLCASSHWHGRLTNPICPSSCIVLELLWPPPHKSFSHTGAACQLPGSAKYAGAPSAPPLLAKLCSWAPNIADQRRHHRGQPSLRGNLGKSHCVSFSGRVVLSRSLPARSLCCPPQPRPLLSGAARSDSRHAAVGQAPAADGRRPARLRLER